MQSVLEEYREILFDMKNKIFLERERLQIMETEENK